MEINHKKCKLIAIDIPALNTINVVSYRLSKTELVEFSEIITKVDVRLQA